MNAKDVTSIFSVGIALTRSTNAGALPSLPAKIYTTIYSWTRANGETQLGRLAIPGQPQLRVPKPSAHHSHIRLAV